MATPIDVWPILVTFSITLWIQLGLPLLSIIVGLPLCVCTHPINPLDIHLLWCSHGNEFIETHDIIHDIIAFIAKEVGLHVVHDQLHIVPSSIHLDAMLTLSLQGWGSNPCRHCYCWFHMFISFGMCIFYTWFCSIRGSPKNKDCHLGDRLLPSAIKVFEYLHMQVDDFLQLCANKMCGMEGLEGPLLWS